MHRLQSSPTPIPVFANSPIIARFNGCWVVWTSLLTSSTVGNQRSFSGSLFRVVDVLLVSTRVARPTDCHQVRLFVRPTPTERHDVVYFEVRLCATVDTLVAIPREALFSRSNPLGGVQTLTHCRLLVHRTGIECVGYHLSLLVSTPQQVLSSSSRVRPRGNSQSLYEISRISNSMAVSIRTRKLHTAILYPLRYSAPPRAWRS